MPVQTCTPPAAKSSCGSRSRWAGTSTGRAYASPNVRSVIPSAVRFSFSVYLPFQILRKSVVAGTVYGKHGGTGLQLVLIPLHVRIAPTVGVPEVDTGHRFQFAVVKANWRLPYIAILPTRVVLVIPFSLLPFGNDIDDSGNGIAAVK